MEKSRSATREDNSWNLEKQNYQERLSFFQQRVEMQLTKFILLCISISLESNILLSTLNLEKLRSFQCSFSRIDINFCGIIQGAFLIFPPVKLQDLQNYQRTLTLWPLIFIYTVKDLCFFHKNGYIILKTLKRNIFKK